MYPFGNLRRHPCLVLQSPHIPEILRASYSEKPPVAELRAQHAQNPAAKSLRTRTQGLGPANSELNVLVGHHMRSFFKRVGYHTYGTDLLRGIEASTFDMGTYNTFLC